MKAQGIKSLVAAVSSVLTVGLIIAAGSQPGDLSAVPVAPVVQPLSPLSVSSAQPDLPSLSDVRALPGHREDSTFRSDAPMSGARSSATATRAEPEEAPGEDTTVLTTPSVVPTAPIPSVAKTTSGALLSMPIQGRRTSRFGMRFHPVRHIWKLHSGLDLAAPCGTPVGAAAPGTVVRAGWAGGNGTQVKIDHGMLGGHRVITTYNHLSAIGVQVGQKVGTHQGVGRVGTTGFSTGCHLHFEVIADGQFTNPEPWLNGGAVVVDTTVMGAGKPGVPGSATPSSNAPTTPSVTASSPTPSPSPSSSQSPGTSPSAPATSASVSPSTSPTASPTVTPTQSVTVTPGVTVTPCILPSPAPEGAANPCVSVTPPVDPTPTPSVPVETVPTPPVALTPTPTPPVETSPTPTPPVETSPTPTPPVETSPTPTPPVDTVPTATKDTTPTATKDTTPTATKDTTPTATKDTTKATTPTTTKAADATPSSLKPSAVEGESTPEA